MSLAGADDDDSTASRAPRVFSAETRKKMAEAQKKRWAAARKSQQG
jgi:hypothetical protein